MVLYRHPHITVFFTMFQQHGLCETVFFTILLQHPIHNHSVFAMILHSSAAAKDALAETMGRPLPIPPPRAAQGRQGKFDLQNAQSMSIFLFGHLQLSRAHWALIHTHSLARYDFFLQQADGSLADPSRAETSRNGPGVVERGRNDLKTDRSTSQKRTF